MKTLEYNRAAGHDESGNSFDLVRLSKSKRAVDVSPNSIRKYASEGLRLYRVGKAVFFSKNELQSFIRIKASGGAA